MVSVGDRAIVQWTGMNGPDWANRTVGTITGVREGGGFWFRHDGGGLPYAVNSGKGQWGEIVEVLRERE